MRSPHVTVIVLNWNGLDDTIECLKSIRAQTYASLDVVVVDNGSSGDDADKIENQFGEFVTVLRNSRNLGYAGGCNTGLSYSLTRPSEYVLLLNNDIVLAPDCLEELVNCAERSNRIGAVLPAEYSYERKDMRRFPRGSYRLPVLAFLALQPIAPVMNRVLPVPDRAAVRVSVIETGMTLMRTEALRRIGLFDPTYFYGGAENLEVTRDLGRLGYTAYVATHARLWHKGAASVGGHGAGLTYNTYCGVRNRVYFVRKNLPGGLKLAYLTMLVLLHSPVLMAQRLIGARSATAAWAVARGVWAGARMEITGTRTRP